jgi:anthranilate phosphoribosyltransferase
MKPQEALTRIIEHREIFHDEMLSLMRQIMSGEVSPVLISAIIAGLRVKKETIGEIAAAATVMREFATMVPMPDLPELIDTCGTGGDSAHTFNVSTAAMFVAAAAGAKIAKHGGRSVSSKSGSADVLELLGVNINLKPEAVAQSIALTGIGFMFAPNHHSAMKHAAPVRRELGQVREYMVAPADVGLKTHSNAAIRVEDVEQSRDMLLGALENKPGAARDIVALNAGASIYIAGLAPNLADGVVKALTVLESGDARRKLQQFVEFTKTRV